MTVEDNLRKLLDLLESGDETTVNTSIRLPVTLRSAAAIAADLGLGGSTTELTVRALRDFLEGFARRAALDAHYRKYPDARPTLAEIAMAAAELDGNPLAGQPELIRRAATEIVAVTDDPTADDVLMYAAGLASAPAA